MTAPRSKRRLLLVSLAILLLFLTAGATLAVVFLASNDARGTQSSELTDDDDWEEHLTFRQRMTRIKVGFLFLWYDTKEAISRRLAGESVEVPPPTVQFEADPETVEPDAAEPPSADSSDADERSAQE